LIGTCRPEYHAPGTVILIVRPRSDRNFTSPIFTDVLPFHRI
jgi:hypothetical protein